MRKMKSLLLFVFSLTFLWMLTATQDIIYNPWSGTFQYSGGAGGSYTFSTGLSEVGGTVTTNDAQINHDSLLNFSLSEHYTMASINTVGTIGTGVWQGTAIDHERGGLEADISAYNGLLKVSGGSTSSITDSSTNWNSAYTHVSNNGSDHSYINQNVTTTGDPTFSDLTVTTVNCGSEYNNGNVSGAVVINFANGQAQRMTLTGDISISYSNFSGCAAVRVKFIQDGTGGHSITGWAAGTWWGGKTITAITEDSNAVNQATIYFDGTNYTVQILCNIGAAS